MAKEDLEVSSSMSKEELEKRKLHIERRKLLVELRHLQFPWWRKPAYLGILLPTVLAFGTLSIAFFTGYFQNEHKLIEIRRERAAEREQELNKSISDLTAQRDQLDLDYGSKKKELEGKINQAEKDIQKIDIGRITLLEESQAKRQELIDKAQALDADFKKKSEALALELSNRRAEFEATKKALAKSTIMVELSPPDSDLSLEDRISKAVRFLSSKKDDSSLYLNALEEMAKGKDDLQDIFLIILYRVTGNLKWKQELFQLARERIGFTRTLFASNRAITMSPVFTEVQWSQEDILDIIDLMAQIMETKVELSEVIYLTPNDASALQVIYKLYDPHLYAGMVGLRRKDPFRNTRGYFTALRVLRDQTFENKLPRGARQSAFDMLSRLSPPFYLAAVAHEVTRQDRDEPLVKSIFQNQKGKIDQYLRTFSTPFDTSDVSSWRKWLEGHDVMLKLCMEEDLSTLRAKPEALEKAMK